MDISDFLFDGAPSSFEPQSASKNLIASPLKFIVAHTYQILLWLRGAAYHPPLHQKPIRVVCMSDTHNHTLSHVPEGDLLVHAGDLTDNGSPEEIQAQLDWLNSLPHKEKIIIPGNHDTFCDFNTRLEGDRKKKLNFGGIQYIHQRAVTLKFPSHNNRSLNIYGAAQSPVCGPDFAFQYPRIYNTWADSVPDDTDILVTHTPPRYHLDLPAGLGDEFLLEEVWRVKPTLHVFGHVHAGSGKQAVFWDEGQRAYERVAAGNFSPLSALLDSMKVFLYGVQGVFWNRIWGGHVQGGWMVNASLVYKSTGKIGNPVRVVEI